MPSGSEHPHRPPTDLYSAGLSVDHPSPTSCSSRPSRNTRNVDQYHPLRLEHDSGLELQHSHAHSQVLVSYRGDRRVRLGREG